PNAQLHPGFHWVCTSSGWQQAGNTGCSGEPKPKPPPCQAIVCNGNPPSTAAWVYVPAPCPPKKTSKTPATASDGPTARSPDIQPEGGTHASGFPAGYHAATTDETTGRPAARPGGANVPVHADYTAPVQ